MKGYIPLPEEESQRVSVERTPVGQWILVLADNRNRAWNGARWVPHHNGYSDRTYVTSFSKQHIAEQYASDLGFKVVNSGAAA